MAVGLAEDADAQAIISSGSLKLGIHPEGHLNVPGTIASSSGTTAVGLRFLVDGVEYESTAPGCLCEGWGYAFDAVDETTGEVFDYHGYANESSCGTRTSGMTPLPMLSTASTATTVVQATRPPPPAPDPISDPLGFAEYTLNDTLEQVLGTGTLTNVKIQHDFYPDPMTSYAYHVDVTVINDGETNVTNLRYRRAMDWDVEPTPFSEYTTIETILPRPPELAKSDTNGFACSDPTMAYSSYRVGPPSMPDIIDAGPSDHGAVFDFKLPPVPPHTSYKFYLYYGAAPSEEDAYDAIEELGMMVWSMGQQREDPSGGTPATFFFGFGFIRIPVTPDADFETSHDATKCGDQVIEFRDLSTDDGGIILWRWDFGDGYTDETTGPVVSHVFPRDDLFTVTLNVTDTDGFTDEVSKAVRGYGPRICPTNPSGSVPGERGPPDARDESRSGGDSDQDGSPDGADDCPVDGGPPGDIDSDGVADACDPDKDGDRIPNDADNCVDRSNMSQVDGDGDGAGDACDDDLDGDTVPNLRDNCVLTPNKPQDDADSDLVGDACDLDANGDGAIDLRTAEGVASERGRNAEAVRPVAGLAAADDPFPVLLVVLAVAAALALTGATVAVGLRRRK